MFLSFKICSNTRALWAFNLGVKSEKEAWLSNKWYGPIEYWINNHGRNSLGLQRCTRNPQHCRAAIIMDRSIFGVHSLMY